MLNHDPARRGRCRAPRLPEPERQKPRRILISCWPARSRGHLGTCIPVYKADMIIVDDNTVLFKKGSTYSQRFQWRQLR